MGDVNIVKLPPNVGETGNLLNLATPIEVFKAGIPIGMQPTGEVFEMISWPTAFAIGRKAIEGCRMWIASPVPFVPKINP